MSDLVARWPLGDDLADIRDALVAAYSTGRGYHDGRHLAEVLDRLDELRKGGEEFDDVPVRLAAWFHDAVYDGAPGDEERSAQWAESALSGDPHAAEVSRLVRLTEHHRPANGDANGCALTDADLAILAAGPERYAEYAGDVRREHDHVPDEGFRTGRSAVLRDLLAKPALFHTTYAREHWEAVARGNVEAELSRLDGACGDAVPR